MKKELHFAASAVQKELETASSWEIGCMLRGLIESPIDFLFAEHHRQRQAANILQQIADGEFDKIGVEKLINFLEADFAIHVADEEIDFFPLLEQHCLPEDKIQDLIARLTEDHKKDKTAVMRVIDFLQELLAGATSNPEARATIGNFAEHVLQHLAIENAVLLPIARARLDSEALSVLSGMMKERRSLRKQR